MGEFHEVTFEACDSKIAIIIIAIITRAHLALSS